MNVELSQLPNGVTMITAPMPHLHSVTVVYELRLGARYEAEAEAGISHFIEHMLFKGTRRFPTARAISEAIENLGGDLDGSTSKEFTDYSVQISSEHLDIAFDVLTDLIRAPLFAPEEIEKERRVIGEELRMYKDSPQDWVPVLLNESLFPGAPLGREVVGSPATLQAITREQMLRYLATHYVPQNLVVSVAGNTTPEAVRAALTQRLGDWTAAPPPAPLPASIALDGPHAVIDARPTEQVNLCLAFPALGYLAPNYDTLALLNAILGGGMSSRLFQAIREDRGLAYEVDSSLMAFRETGYLEIGVGCDPEQVEAVLRAVLAEVRRLCDAPPPAPELQRIKDYTRGRLVIGLEGTASVAGWYGAQVVQRGTYRSIEAILADIDAVTPEAVQTLAQRIFTTAGLHLAAIGPLPAAAHFLPLLHV